MFLLSDVYGGNIQLEIDSPRHWTPAARPSNHPTTQTPHWRKFMRIYVDFPRYGMCLLPVPLNTADVTGHVKLIDGTRSC